MLHHDCDGAPRKQDWSYWSAIGMLNFLCGSSCSELACAMHQCARFSQDPKASHEHAVLCIVQYLKCTQHMGLIMTPTSSCLVDCYCNSDFAGSLSHADSLNPKLFLSRSGFVIMFAVPLSGPANCKPKSRSLPLRPNLSASAQAFAKSFLLLLFLRNSVVSYPPAILSPTSIALFLKMTVVLWRWPEYQKRPCTKHLGLKLHHFRKHVRCGTIIPVAIETNEQPANIFTKPLPRNQFQYLRRKVCGW